MGPPSIGMLLGGLALLAADVEAGGVLLLLGGLGWVVAVALLTTTAVRLMKAEPGCETGPVRRFTAAYAEASSSHGMHRVRSPGSDVLAQRGPQHLAVSRRCGVAVCVTAVVVALLAG